MTVAPALCAATTGNVIVWAILLTVMVCLTAVAAEYVAFPAWEAVKVQVPAPTNETVVAEIVQTVDGEAVYDTARFELAVAATVAVALTFCEAMAGKVIVCASLETAKLCVSEVAA